jgi:hypothetical protein
MVNCGTGSAEAAMRNERAMNAIAMAVEKDNVCNFIFKNVWH